MKDLGSRMTVGVSSEQRVKDIISSLKGETKELRGQSANCIIFEDLKVSENDDKKY